MIRLRFHASWLPHDHNEFWTNIDCTENVKTINDLIEYFNEQQKSLANYYEFSLPKRSTKLKYIKAFLNDCVLPPHARTNQILRENDEIHFRLELDAQTEWLLVKSSPSLKRKLSVVEEIPPPSSAPTPSQDMDTILRSIAEPTEVKSLETPSFTFQFGNKRGRPIPPRPPVMSVSKINSLIPRQVIKNRK